MLVDEIPVIDCDSHVTEPPDLWTSRLGDRWGELTPHVVFDEKHQFYRWYAGGKRLAGVAASAQAGWSEYPPRYPPTLEEADPGSWDPKVRLERLDEYGIYAQVLYPNILGFSLYAILETDNDEFKLACVRAYNDFLTEFASADPERLLPISCLPFWDVEASVAEMQRCYEMGHRGALFANAFERIGLPPITDTHWDPIYATAQELDFSINFHIGFTEVVTENEVRAIVTRSSPAWERVVNGSMFLMSNAKAIATVVTSDLCDRFPELRFVSVESGAGWLPFLAEALDWNWRALGAEHEYPGRLLPSEYMRRQVYGSFWFEEASARSALDVFGNNLMFETDYPHPVSLSPGPASPSANPRDVIERAFTGVSRSTTWEVLHGTAAKLYKVRVPQES